MIVLKKAVTGLHRSLLVSLLGLAMVSCGTAIVTAGISGTGIVVGTITAFGSIWVNGVEYNIDNASFDVDGTRLTGLAGQKRLSEGMVVKLQASDSGNGKGVAKTVVYSASIKGPVETLSTNPVAGNTNLKQMTVVGQTVVISKISTRFAGGFDFTTINVNDIVEISGFVDANGTIKATLVKKEGQLTTGKTTHVELHGAVSLVSGNAGSSFMLNNQLVNYDNNTVGVGLLSQGAKVEVIGNYSQLGQPVQATLIKQEASEQQEIENSTGEVRLQGLVSDLKTAVSTFKIDGVVVNYSNINSTATAGLKEGVQVEINGKVDSNGVLVLSQLEIDHESGRGKGSSGHGGSDAGYSSGGDSSNGGSDAGNGIGGGSSNGGSDAGNGNGGDSSNGAADGRENGGA